MLRNRRPSIAITPQVGVIDRHDSNGVTSFFRLSPRSAGRRPRRIEQGVFRARVAFVMANETPHADDFFMMVCGRLP
ncbi:hypothetical protein ACVIJ6_000051 [Bradyrhizobium sp. USDA 4369]